MFEYALNDRWKSINRHIPNIVTTQHYSDEWSAHDDDTYGGPPDPVGTGRTEQEAVDELIAKLCD